MTRIPPTIDMLPDGTFRSARPAWTPQSGVRMPFSIKLGVGAALVAVLGLALSVAALAIWVVSMILPVIIIAGAVAWGTVRYRRWQLGRGQAVRPAQAGRFGQ